MRREQERRVGQMLVEVSQIAFDDHVAVAAALHQLGEHLPGFDLGELEHGTERLALVVVLGVLGLPLRL